MEVWTLVVPTLWFLLAARPAEAVSLSAMTTVCVSPFAVAAFRGGYVGGGRWPKPGHYGTLAARSAYYSLVVGAATYLGVVSQVRWGSFLLGIVVPAVVCVAALAALPRVLGAFARLSRVRLY